MRWVSWEESNERNVTQYMLSGSCHRVYLSRRCRHSGCCKQQEKANMDLYLKNLIAEREQMRKRRKKEEAERARLQAV
eukprot:3616445-Rhodomonas_salina.1